MARKGKLQSALDADKGTDPRLEQQKRLRKRAEKAKREKQRRGEEDGEKVVGADESVVNGEKEGGAAGDGDVGWEDEDEEDDDEEENGSAAGDGGEVQVCSFCDWCCIRTDISVRLIV